MGINVQGTVALFSRAVTPVAAPSADDTRAVWAGIEAGGSPVSVSGLDRIIAVVLS